MGRIIGDFRELEEQVACGKMTQDEYQEIFSKARVHGLDDSIYPFAVGGSDAAVITGDSTWKTPVKLYREKTGEFIETVVDPANKLGLYIGHVFEGPFRDFFEKVEGIPCFPYYKQTVSDEYPHCVANIDGLCVYNGELYIYEGKTTRNPKYQYMFKDEKAPKQYVIQTYFYMEVIDKLDKDTLAEVDPKLPSMLSDFEIKGAIINCGWGINDGQMRHVIIPRNKEYGQEILDACESFVINAEKGIEPTNEDVLNLSLLEKDEYANWGAIDKSAPPVTLDKKFLGVLESIVSIDEECAKIKNKLKKRDEEIKKIKNDYESLEKILQEFEETKDELLMPFIDEIKNSTKAVLEADGCTYEMTYDGSTKSRYNAAVKAKFKENYPEIYKEIEGVGKNEFKKLYPDIYKEVMNYEKYNSRKWELKVY